MRIGGSPREWIAVSRFTWCGDLGLGHTCMHEGFDVLSLKLWNR